VIRTGPITNHVNFVRTPEGQFAYVSVGGLDEVQVFRTDTFAKVARVHVGRLPHGVWPSGDGRQVFVGLENDDALAVIETSGNRLVRTIPIGQAPQAIAYVAGASPDADAPNLVPLGIAGNAAKLALGAGGRRLSNVTLFEQGLVQILQASVTRLIPGRSYQLVLASNADGLGPVEPLADFKAGPSGSAIVNATGPIRQIVTDGRPGARSWLAIREGTSGAPGRIVQVEQP
jgi:YVTN family beta-propeller protein